MGVRTSNSLTVIETITIGADGFTPALDVSKYTTYSYQITFTYSGGDNSAGTVTLQVSDNNALFSSISSSVLNYTSATTNNIFEVLSVGHQWSRLAIDNTSGSGGTAKVTFFGVVITD